MCTASASDGEAHRRRAPAAVLRQPPRAQAQHSSPFRLLQRPATLPSHPRALSASSRRVRFGGRTWLVFAATRTFRAIKASCTKTPGTRLATRLRERALSSFTRSSPICSLRRAATSSSFRSTVVLSTTSSAWTQCLDLIAESQAVV